VDGEGGFLEKLNELLEKGKPYLEVGQWAWKRLMRHRVVGVPVWNEVMEEEGKALRKENWSYRAIAEDLGVGTMTVWRHISPKGRYYRGFMRFLRHKRT